MRNILERQVGELVMEDSRAVDVFYKYGIDFCCGGKQLLGNACEKKSIDPALLLKEIEEQGRFYKTSAGTESLSELIDHILKTHHDYIDDIMPMLHAMAEKISNRHGNRVVEIFDLAKVLIGFEQELRSHMMKEENILFPYIKHLELVKSGVEKEQMPAFGTIDNPISVMLHEHDDAGNELEKIRNLSDQISAYEDQCATMILFKQKLDEFEKNMMIHVHLENNVLFIRAQELEEQVRSNDFEYS